ncbi:MAG: radical SAM protein [Sedimentisphaerales bacterium]|nr:radical SAM protein [Sedimentisphaerales bacterium]
MDWLLARKAWEVIRKPLVCARPYYVQFEVTTHCNLACYMCVRSEVIKHPRHLAYEDFRQTLDRIGAPKLTLSGAGEPLLNPDLAKMIAHARSRGISVMIPTNGTLLRQPALAQAMVDSGLNVLKISLDAATPQTYRAIRRHDCFEQVVEGIERLDRLKQDAGRRFPDLRFDVVILKENYREIPEIIRLAARLGIHMVFFRAVQTKGIGAERERTIGKDLDFDELYRCVQQGIKVATELAVRTNLKDVARNFRIYQSIYIRQDAAMSRHVCLLPWLQCFVSVKGEVSPCCATYTNESLSAGNVFTDDFEAVWNGPKMREIRRQFRSRRNPLAVCRDCIPRSVPVLLKMSAMLPGFTYDD